MLDREQKYLKDLERCRESIKRTKGLIDYHKGMLKKLESKENEISAKLEKIKMSSLCDLINKGGYDIDSIREAVVSGDLSVIISAKSDNEPAEENITENTEAVSSYETAVKIVENERKY